MINKFENEGYCDYSSEWAVYQHMLVQVKNGAFRDAQFEYKCSNIHRALCRRAYTWFVDVRLLQIGVDSVGA